MRINVHAGHNPAGKVACGAVGLINESTEARRVKDEVISKLRQLGHTVLTVRLITVPDRPMC